MEKLPVPDVDHKYVVAPTAIAVESEKGAVPQVDPSFPALATVVTETVTILVAGKLAHPPIVTISV